MSNLKASSVAVATFFRRRPVRYTFGALAVSSVLGYGYYEFEVASPLQAKIFGAMAEGKFAAKQVTKTPPAEGPKDIKLCYNLVSDLRKTLPLHGDIVSPQVSWTQHGIGPYTLPPIFDRPINAGLRITDSQGRLMYDATKHTVRPYHKFDEVPNLLALAFGFVEDQNILNPNKKPTFNSAVNIRRSGNAVLENVAKSVGLRDGASGGSTIPVQVAKLEAWKDGKTRDIFDKLDQHVFASVRQYQDGSDTTGRRHSEFVNYLNTVSFAGHPAVGEIMGVREAMAVLFSSTDYDSILKQGKEDIKTARIFRQIFTLAMAVQMPDRVLRDKPVKSDVSMRGFQMAQKRLDNLLPKLAKEGIITPAFAEMVAAQKLDYANLGKNPSLPPPFARDKSVDSLRLSVMNSLNLNPKDGLYVLDHCDLTIQSTLDRSMNEALNRRFRDYNDPTTAMNSGLTGDKKLRPQTASRAIWGITINQVMPDGRTVTRVSTDTFQGALDLNKGGKQNFGSTQKLRMLTSYLDVIADLHRDLARKDASELAGMSVHPNDKLTRWAVDYLIDPATEKSLNGMLVASLQRKYSAAPAGFFTGGGMNYPQNFERKNNGGQFTVEQALWQSINLSWFRITEDIREHNKWYRLKTNPDIMSGKNTDPTVQSIRTTYMDKYALHEGSLFLERAWKRMRDKDGGQIHAEMLKRTTGAATPLTVAHFSIMPDASYGSMLAMLKKNCTAKCPDDKKARELFELHAPYRQFDAHNAIVSKIGEPNLIVAMLRDTSTRGTDHLARLLTPTPAPAEPSRTLFSHAEQLAALYGWRHPGSSYQQMRDFVLTHCKECQKTTDYRELHKRYQDGKYDAEARFYKFDLNDRAYLTKINPMTLQLGRLKLANPNVSWDEALAATTQDRIFVDQWRRKPNREKAQNRAITIMLEREAFAVVNQQWQEMGYPFKFRANSLAASIGVEGDNTESLSAYMSILLNNGRSVTPTRYAAMRFGEGTPHDMSVRAGQPKSQQVIDPEVAALTLRVARGTVENPNGTGRRLNEAFKLADGTVVPVGCKTGTNGESSTMRRETYMRGAFLVCNLGPSLAMTLQVYVPGATSADRFTSSVPVSALRDFTPIIQPLLERTYSNKVQVPIGLPPLQDNVQRPVTSMVIPGGVPLANVPVTRYVNN